LDEDSECVPAQEHGEKLGVKVGLGKGNAVFSPGNQVCVPPFRGEVNKQLACDVVNTAASGIKVVDGAHDDMFPRIVVTHAVRGDFKSVMSSREKAREVHGHGILPSLLTVYAARDVKNFCCSATNAGRGWPEAITEEAK
jgi:hypothetical protein